MSHNNRAANVRLRSLSSSEIFARMCAFRFISVSSEITVTLCLKREHVFYATVTHKNNIIFYDELKLQARVEITCAIAQYNHLISKKALRPNECPFVCQNRQKPSLSVYM